ncbi:response regulator [Leptolyngbya sp. FACHB-16]|nr:response regulator [Leptolyngbya sp. FACHB-8]MBD2153399.1 response regulator [Leptolyngbya sp. FACHB-16]
MGARIKAFDWASTSIGPIETWSQSLQVTLQVLLLSKFPMQILWGPDYIHFYNDAYISIAGSKHPKALGQAGSECWKEVWDVVGPMLNQVVATGKATWSEDLPLQLERFGQPEIGYFTFSYTPIWEESGRVGGIFIAVNETTQKIISERRERELRLETQAAKEEAEQANHLKDRFLAVLAHELRSPLNSILGWSKLLLLQKLDAEVTQRALETIERNAKLQAQMIDDLLDTSRILRDKLTLNIVPTPLIPIIEDAMETVHSMAKSKSIQLITQFENTPHYALGDANRLKQVVWNLLSNAIKFSPIGGKIIIQLNYFDVFAQIQVIDDGRGISADFLPHVFEHFEQADSTTTRTYGGLGLGLAIAKQIVDKHEGRIHAASYGEGQGATFTVQIPLAATPSMPVSTNLPTNEDRLDNIHVLVVDDDADNREMITFALEMYGARVTTSSSASDALDTLSQCKPDVLLSDIGMSEMDGYTLMQHIRKVTQTSQIPAIALTAYISEADRQQALAAGFQEHMPKPLEPALLVETILKLVKGYTPV